MYLLMRNNASLLASPEMCIRDRQGTPHLFHTFQCLVVIVQVNESGHQLLVVNLLHVQKGLGLVNQVNGDVYKRQGQPYSFSYPLPAYGTAIFRF